MTLIKKKEKSCCCLMIAIGICTDCHGETMIVRRDRKKANRIKPDAVTQKSCRSTRTLKTTIEMQ